ncbi:AraC family transcriptional regulator [Dokdonella sp. MW10]|uniref:AraC family transcriptional regulator n=1 Tax=Dokdonella sp. MW10 TaxID=2992926 RepID=UPI003F7DDE36
MKDIHPYDVDTVPGALLGVANDYVAGEHVGRHQHWRAQFVYAASGVVAIGTELGSWIVPSERAVWIPAGVPHEVTAMSAAHLISLYIDTTRNAVAMPATCRVVGASPLMGALMREVIDLPDRYLRGSRTDLVLLLLLREIEAAAELPLNVPIPNDARLAARCRAYLQHPSPHETIDDWCADLAMSRRSFTRRFRSETGFSFAAWCRQASLFAALPRLAAGDAITTIAFDLGYESASAFATMFRRTIGVAPSRYFSPSPGAT